jgi:translocator protein
MRYYKYQMNSYYQSLKKPSWTPPDATFGIVWGTLYPIIFIVNFYAASKILAKDWPTSVGIPFWLNLVFNFAFTSIQFGLKNNLLASIDIALILITIIWSIYAVWPYSKISAIAFIPYLIWVTIATVLQIQIYLLNR